MADNPFYSAPPPPQQQQYATIGGGNPFGGESGAKAAVPPPESSTYAPHSGPPNGYAGQPNSAAVAGTGANPFMSSQGNPYSGGAVGMPPQPPNPYGNNNAPPVNHVYGAPSNPFGNVNGSNSADSVALVPSQQQYNPYGGMVQQQQQQLATSAHPPPSPWGLGPPPGSAGFDPFAPPPPPPPPPLAPVPVVVAPSPTPAQLRMAPPQDDNPFGPFEVPKPANPPQEVDSKPRTQSGSDAQSQALTKVSVDQQPSRLYGREDGYQEDGGNFRDGGPSYRARDTYASAENRIVPHERAEDRMVVHSPEMQRYRDELARRAPQGASPLPKAELVRKKGYVLSRISFRTIVMKKWKQSYWVQYGPHTMLWFRSEGDFADWLNNPYHDQAQRNFLIKLAVNFVHDLYKPNVRGYQVTQCRVKGYGKKMVRQFKLERWMDYGPTIAAAFGSYNPKEVDDLRVALVECMRNTPLQGGIRATGLVRQTEEERHAREMYEQERQRLENGGGRDQEGGYPDRRREPTNSYDELPSGGETPVDEESAAEEADLLDVNNWDDVPLEPQQPPMPTNAAGPPTYVSDNQSVTSAPPPPSSGSYYGAPHVQPPFNGSSSGGRSAYGGAMPPAPSPFSQASAPPLAQQFAMVPAAHPPTTYPGAPVPPQMQGPYPGFPPTAQSRFMEPSPPPPAQYQTQHHHAYGFGTIGGAASVSGSVGGDSHSAYGAAAPPPQPQRPPSAAGSNPFAPPTATDPWVTPPSPPQGQQSNSQVYY